MMLIDSDKLLPRLWDYISDADYEKLKKVISKMPSAEPEIIYCKDCKHYTKEFGWNGTEYTVCSEVGHHRSLVSADDFCSWAERRADDKINKGSSC